MKPAYFLLLQAATAGAKDQEAVNFLEKKVKGAEPLPYAEAVQLAIGALQNVLSEDFKATDIEVLPNGFVCNLSCVHCRGTLEPGSRRPSACIRSPVCCCGDVRPGSRRAVLRSMFCVLLIHPSLVSPV